MTQIEIERKAWVKDLEGLRRALTERYGAPFEVEKEDRYYIEPGVPHSADSLRSARVTRLRRENEKAIVTAKKRALHGATEVNHEIEFRVDDPVAFDAWIQEALGFEILVEKTKRAFVFRSDCLTLELCHVKFLGWFLEVEFLAQEESAFEEASHQLDEAFARYQTYLGDFEPTQYIVLLLEKDTGSNEMRNET